MKLISLNRMAKEPLGTYFFEVEFGDEYDNIEFDEEKERQRIINFFKENPYKLINSISVSELYVFGDNFHSMNYDSAEEDGMYVWDYNIVGDAYPYNVLYIVVEENELPEELKFIIEYRNKFVQKYKRYEEGQLWAIKTLEQYVEDGSIIDLEIHYNKQEK